MHAIINLNIRPFKKDIQFTGFDSSIRRFSNEVNYFDLLKDKWVKVETTGNPPVEGCGQSLTLVDEKLFVFGGMTFDQTYLASLHCLNLNTNTWSICEGKTNVAPEARLLHSVVHHEGKYLKNKWHQYRFVIVKKKCFNLLKNIKNKKKTSNV